MQINTITEARIYEEQGHKDQALEIYKNILLKDASNKAAKEAIMRLSGFKVRKNGVNMQMLEFLRNASNQAQMNEFRRWLINL